MNYLESGVRVYNRTFPAEFATGKGSFLFDRDGNAYLDFFSGAGALNLGHNHPRVIEAIRDYLAADGVLHALDMDTVARREFVVSFADTIMAPRKLIHKVHITAPTGADAIEAALKIARKATGRSGAIAFSGSYHGMTLGALSVTSNRTARAASGATLPQISFIPYPSTLEEGACWLNTMSALFADDHGGWEIPACLIVEPIQAEGGVNIPPAGWMILLYDFCRTYNIVLILDEIQTGWGRTGEFFGFEHERIVPDIVVMSKSLSGVGLPFSMVLLSPELDVLNPGEHSGTFRGNQLAMVSARAALTLWREGEVGANTYKYGELISQGFAPQAARIDPAIEVRGRGLIWGVDLSKLDADLPRLVAEKCFAQGLLVERVGRRDSVLKLLPPLTISRRDLENGLSIILDALRECL